MVDCMLWIFYLSHIDLYNNYLIKDQQILEELAYWKEQAKEKVSAINFVIHINLNSSLCKSVNCCST